MKSNHIFKIFAFSLKPSPFHPDKNERVVDIDIDKLTNIDIKKKRDITLAGHSVYVGKSGHFVISAPTIMDKEKCFRKKTRRKSVDLNTGKLK